MSDSEKLPKKIGTRKKPGAKTPPIANSAEEPKKKNRKSISSKDLYPAARLSLAITNAGFFRFYGRKPRNKPSLPDNGVLLPRGYKSNLFLVGDTKLHSSDEEVLIALLAIAADKHRSGTYNIKAKERNALDENLRHGEVISISFIRSELAKILGWRINKATYVAILHSLIRLNMATFKELPEKPEATNENPNPKPHSQSSIPHSRLIAFTKDIAIIKEGQGLQEIEWARQRTVEVILCEHLSRFVLDTKMKVAYGLHLMDERRLLNRLGKTLYTHIVAHVWPGKKGKIHLDNVLRKITGRKPSAADRISAIKALQPISGSPPTKESLQTKIKAGSAKAPPRWGWKIVPTDRGSNTTLHVTRPRLPFSLMPKKKTDAVQAGKTPKKKTDAVQAGKTPKKKTDAVQAGKPTKRRQSHHPSLTQPILA